MTATGSLEAHCVRPGEWRIEGYTVTRLRRRVGRGQRETLWEISSVRYREDEDRWVFTSHAHFHTFVGAVEGIQDELDRRVEGRERW